MIRIFKYGEVANKDIFSRMAPEMKVEDTVAEIIANVRANGQYHESQNAVAGRFVLAE